VKSLLAAQVII